MAFELYKRHVTRRRSDSRCVVGFRNGGTMADYLESDGRNALFGLAVVESDTNWPLVLPKWSRSGEVGRSPRILATRKRPDRKGRKVLTPFGLRSIRLIARGFRDPLPVSVVDISPSASAVALLSLASVISGFGESMCQLVAGRNAFMGHGFQLARSAFELKTHRQRRLTGRDKYDELLAHSNGSLGERAEFATSTTLVSSLSRGIFRSKNRLKWQLAAQFG